MKYGNPQIPGKRMYTGTMNPAQAEQIMLAFYDRVMGEIAISPYEHAALLLSIDALSDSKGWKDGTTTLFLDSSSVNAIARDQNP